MLFKVLLKYLPLVSYIRMKKNMLVLYTPLILPWTMRVREREGERGGREKWEIDEQHRRQRLIFFFFHDKSWCVFVKSSSRLIWDDPKHRNRCDKKKRKKKKKEEEEGKEREGKRVGLVLRWLVWWVGDRESWSITYWSPIASVRGVVGMRGRVKERRGRESVWAWLLNILTLCKW